MKIYVYETRFTNGRDDFLDVICANNKADAERRATVICRGISDDQSCDAEVEIVGEAATDAATLTGSPEPSPTIIVANELIELEDK